MSARGDGLERRPARFKADTRVARAVAAAVRELAGKYPGHHVCATYEDPMWICVNVVDHSGATLAQEWLAK